MYRAVQALAATAALLLSAAPGHALDEAIGRALFRRAWVPAPSSTRANDGLGPLFNARSCAACHRGLDRAQVRTGAKGIVESDGLVLRFSDAAGRPDPTYGLQLQTSSVTGTVPEGRILATERGYRPALPAEAPLAPGTRTGALLAPSLRGLGALESIPDAAILALAEANRQREDGVAGRVNWVADRDGRRRVGRFGWKASAASLTAQVESAFLLDLGLSTEGHPAPQGDCTAAQESCLSAPMGSADGTAEIPPELVSRVVAYLASVPPAAPEEQDAKGAELFAGAGCAACHRPALPGGGGPVRAFTDLLLHDLGPGLDGGATEPGVAPTEWRTAPLWGLGGTLAQGGGLLHDGRAPTVEAAIALHGGEAASARALFTSLPEADRQRLVAYLKSL